MATLNQFFGYQHNIYSDVFILPDYSPPLSSHIYALISAKDNNPSMRVTKKVAHQNSADKIVSKFGVPRLTGCAGKPLSQWSTTNLGVLGLF